MLYRSGFGAWGESDFPSAPTGSTTTTTNIVALRSQQNKWMEIGENMGSRARARHMNWERERENGSESGRKEEKIINKITKCNRCFHFTTNYVVRDTQQYYWYNIAFSARRDYSVCVHSFSLFTFLHRTLITFDVSYFHVQKIEWNIYIN